MTRRIDPMFYEFEIQEHETGECRRVPIHCWWSDGSADGLRKMCDCQLGAYFETDKRMRPTNESPRMMDWGNFFAPAQHQYLKTNECQHSPSRRYTVLRAFLPGDQIIEIAQ